MMFSIFHKSAMTSARKKKFVIIYYIALIIYKKHNNMMQVGIFRPACISANNTIKANDFQLLLQISYRLEMN